MKYAVVLLALLMVGCGSGYEVRQVDVYRKELKFACTYKRPIFFNDVQEQICDTAEECNRVCDAKRGNK